MKRALSQVEGEIREELKRVGEAWEVPQNAPGATPCPRSPSAALQVAGSDQRL